MKYIVDMAVVQSFQKLPHINLKKMEFGKKKMNRPFLRCAPTCYLVG
jgi:hypothetical protein